MAHSIQCPRVVPQPGACSIYRKPIYRKKLVLVFVAARRKVGRRRPGSPGRLLVYCCEEGALMRDRRFPVVPDRVVSPPPPGGSGKACRSAVCAWFGDAVSSSARRRGGAAPDLDRADAAGSQRALGSLCGRGGTEGDPFRSSPSRASSPRPTSGYCRRWRSRRSLTCRLFTDLPRRGVGKSSVSRPGAGYRWPVPPAPLWSWNANDRAVAAARPSRLRVAARCLGNPYSPEWRLRVEPS